MVSYTQRQVKKHEEKRVQHRSDGRRYKRGRPTGVPHGHKPLEPHQSDIGGALVLCDPRNAYERDIRFTQRYDRQQLPYPAAALGFAYDAENGAGIQVPPHAQLQGGA